VNWPTPTTAEGKAPTRGKRAQGGTGLSETVRAQGSAWPTPAARDWKDNGNFTPKTPEDRGGKGVPLPHAVGAALNPAWVECLQGFPLGWTEVPAIPPKKVLRSKKKNPC